jgi:hydrogenase expression/formation protein HypC
MCIGIPMRLVEYGSLHARAAGRGREERIDLRLVGACEPGDWVLVFQGAARERLQAQRAAEIDAALDLVEQGLAGFVDADADPGFALPSAMSAADLAALAGPTGAASRTEPAAPAPRPAAGHQH